MIARAVLPDEVYEGAAEVTIEGKAVVDAVEVVDGGERGIATPVGGKDWKKLEDELRFM